MLFTHPYAQTCVCLLPCLHLHGEDVSGVVGLHLFHKNTFLPHQRVIYRHQWVRREIRRVETPRDAIFPRLPGIRSRDETAVPRLAHFFGYNHASFGVTVEPPRLWGHTASFSSGGTWGVVQFGWWARCWLWSRGRGFVRLLVGRTVKPEHSPNQPASHEKQQEAANDQENLGDGAWRSVWQQERPLWLWYLTTQQINNEHSTINTESCQMKVNI